MKSFVHQLLMERTLMAAIGVYFSCEPPLVRSSTRCGQKVFYYNIFKKTANISLNPSNFYVNEEKKLGFK